MSCVCAMHLGRKGQKILRRKPKGTSGFGFGVIKSWPSWDGNHQEKNFPEWSEDE